MIMTREQIEKAANSFAEREYEISDIDKDALYKGFYWGANWCVNSVWHEASKKPQKGKLVLFECKRVYGKSYTVSFGENYNMMKNIIIRWAYVDDLIPNTED